MATSSGPGKVNDGLPPQTQAVEVKGSPAKEGRDAL